MGGGTADDTPSRHFGKRWTNAETIHGTLGSTTTLQLPRNCRSASSCAAHYLQARNHHFEAVVNAGRKSDAENPTQKIRRSDSAKSSAASIRKASQRIARRNGNRSIVESYHGFTEQNRSSVQTNSKLGRTRTYDQGIMSGDEPEE